MITLPSGRVVSVYENFIGINNKGEISKGYDGHIDGAFAQLPGWYWEESEWESWGIEDKLALADIMIKRWEDYRQAVISAKGRQ